MTRLELLSRGGRAALVVGGLPLAGRLAELKLDGTLRRSPFAERIPAILQEAHQLLFEKPVKRLSES